MQTFMSFIDETRNHQDLAAMSQFIANQLNASIRSIHTSDDIDEKVADLCTMVSLSSGLSLLVLGSLEENPLIINSAKNIIRTVQR
jgi:hypothetical protein